MKKLWNMANSILLGVFVMVTLITVTGTASPVLAKTTRVYEVPFGHELVLRRTKSYDYTLTLNGQWVGVDKGAVGYGLEGVFSLNLRMKGSKSLYWRIAGGPGMAQLQGADGETQYAPSTTEFGGLGFRPTKWLELSFVGRHRAIVDNGDLLNSAFAELQVGLFVNDWYLNGSTGIGYGRFPVMKPLTGVKWPAGIDPPLLRDVETDVAQTFGLSLGRRF